MRMLSFALAIVITFVAQHITAEQAFVTSNGCAAASACQYSFTTHGLLTAVTPGNPLTAGAVATTAGYANPTDGGAGTYVWNPSAATTDSTQTFFITPTGWSGNGRWVLQVSPSVSIMVRGASCNGIVDDSTNVSNLMAVAGNLYPAGIKFYVPADASCYLGPNVTPVNTGSMTIIGQSTNPSSYAAGSMRTPDITLAPTQTLQPTYFGRYQDLLVMRQGLPLTSPTTFEQAWSQIGTWGSDTSVGITIAGDHVVLDHVTVVGFNKGFYSSGYQFLTVKDLWIDSYNGFEYTNSRGEGDLTDIKVFSIYVASSTLMGMVSGTIGAPGTGYSNTGTWIMSSAGATCGTLPTGTFTASGGVVQSFVISDFGNCTVLPSSQTVATTGGGGTGFTIVGTFETTSNRPGIGFNIHDKADGLIARGLTDEGSGTGMVLSNIWSAKINGVDMEAGPFNNSGAWTVTGGGAAISLQNCVSGVSLSDVYAQGTAITLDASLLSSAEGGSCSGADNSDASVALSNVYIGAPAGWHNDEILHLGSHSAGTIAGLTVAGPGHTSGSSIVIDANAGNNASATNGWSIHGVISSAALGATTPLYSIVASAAPFIRIDSPQNIVSVASGATHTANCNEIDLVNDATAPTITLPGVCPLDQGVEIKDVGGNAQAHNITVTAPAGTTLDGVSAGSKVLNVNYGAVSISYNGTGAYIQ